MKDGRTHLAHKTEHAVDLETRAIVGVTVQGADQGDTTTMAETLPPRAARFQERLATRSPDQLSLRGMFSSAAYDFGGRTLEITMTSARQSSEYDVFLSHGSPDKPWVRSLYAALESIGIVTYLDEVLIEVGDNFVRHLSDGVGCTSTFVIVVSRETMTRPWVEHEWTSFMATHGPSNRIIPVLLDDVALPPFLRPYLAIHAIDRNVDEVAARIAGAVRKGGATDESRRYTGQGLIFTVTSIEGSDHLVVTSAAGARRTITPPWRLGNAFGIALMDFEKLTRVPVLTDEERMRLVVAAQTVGSALFDLLFSNEALRSTFERATAPGSRAVVTVQSDDDVLLSLPWELFHHNSRFLVRDGVLDIVRSTTGAVQFDALLTPPQEPFTVVTNVSAPEGSALSYEAESFRIAHALADHCPQTPTELGTLDDLVETVARVKPRGIHFSGHGAPGELVFEDDEGFEHRVAIDRLVDELRRRGDGALPPFFFLASCHGNTPVRPAEGQSGSSSAAARLHREGVTEVVGYNGPIADELSTRAEEALYAAVAAGEPTRLAVGRARAALLRDYDGDASPKPVGGSDQERSPARERAAIAHTGPFAWAQLVFYHRGPEYPLGTPASLENLRQREAALTRTYRLVADHALLNTGFIARRRELHQLRRRRRRGDRVFVLQGLGGLGKTTLAGHFLPLLSDEKHTLAIWCPRTEGEPDPAEALVGQLLSYARARFGAGFEQVVSDVDRSASADAAQRFATYLQFILSQQPGRPHVVYFDNLESLLHGPDDVSLARVPDPEAFGTWRSEALQRVWRVVIQLAGTVDNLYVVASCRYRNDDLVPGLSPVSPLLEADLLRLMAWFPALRRLSTRTRARLATRLSGHPRAVQFLDALIGVAIRTWENTHGEWTPPASSDQAALGREWDQVVAPALPEVQERIWSDLLLGALWEGVLDERAHRMLFRMTLLRRPWDEPLIPHLGELDDNADAARRTSRALLDTSLLEQIDLIVSNANRPARQPFFTVHAATAAFVRSRFGEAADLVIESHRRIGMYLGNQARTSAQLSIVIEAGYHFFNAGDLDRASELLVSASEQLQRWGRVREGLQMLVPFLAEPKQREMSRTLVGHVAGTIGSAYLRLGETSRAVEFCQQQLTIAREVGDRSAEGNALGNLGITCAELGKLRPAVELYEQQLVIVREMGDRKGEGRALSNLASAYADLGETERAINLYEERLVIAREIGDRRGEGTVLGNLGLAYAELSDVRRAIPFYELQLAIAREMRDWRNEGIALGNLGGAYAHLGEPRRSIEHHEQALAISRRISDRRSEGQDLGNLGNTYFQLGEIRRAIEYYEQALAIARETGNRFGEGEDLNSLGLAHAALGETPVAFECHSQALVISREVANRRGEGSALGNLGMAHAALGDTRRALEYYDQAVAIARQVGDRRAEGQNLANLGNAYAILGETRHAIDSYEQGLAIGRAISDPQIIRGSENGLRAVRDRN